MAPLAAAASVGISGSYYAYSDHSSPSMVLFQIMFYVLLSMSEVAHAEI